MAPSKSATLPKRFHAARPSHLRWRRMARGCLAYVPWHAASFFSVSFVFPFGDAIKDCWSSPHWQTLQLHVCVWSWSCHLFLLLALRGLFELASTMSDSSLSGLYAVSSVLLAFAVICVALRFYARHVKKAPLLADDWLLIPALVWFNHVGTRRDPQLGLTPIPQLAFIGTCTCIYFGR